MEEPAIAMAAPRLEAPGLDVLVNFGLYAGRTATPAEVDRLAERLVPELGEVSIVLEEHHEFDHTVEAAVHVVRIQVPADRITSDKDAAERRTVALAEGWLRECVEDRRVGP